MVGEFVGSESACSPLLSYLQTKLITRSVAKTATLFLLFALGGADVASRASTAIAGGSTRSEGSDGADAVASVVNTSNLLYIALSFAVSLTVNVWVFFRVSGGLFNPAVTLAMWLIGAVKPVRAMLLVIAQVAGGIAGSAIVYGLLPGMSSSTGPFHHSG
jgi:aquaporin related protein